MKFDQLIQHNIRHIFLEKLYTKRGGETITRSFSKELKLSAPLNQLCKVLCSLLLPCDKLRAIKMY